MRAPRSLRVTPSRRHLAFRQPGGRGWQPADRRRGQHDRQSARPRTYDDELLDAHYIAGDGRANENIGLTAVHHVFHSEHNRLVEHTKDVVLGARIWRS
jgi:hypothetical protein